MLPIVYKYRSCNNPKNKKVFRLNSNLKSNKPQFKKILGYEVFIHDNYKNSLYLGGLIY